MTTLIINLLLINLFVVLVSLSGFWDNLDEWVSSKWKFHHLPHIFICSLCQTFWLSMLYILVTGNLSLFGLGLCIINAHLTKITTPLYTTVENIILGLVNRFNQLIEILLFK